MKKNVQNRQASQGSQETNDISSNSNNRGSKSKRDTNKAYEEFLSSVTITEAMKQSTAFPPVGVWFDHPHPMPCFQIYWIRRLNLLSALVCILMGKCLQMADKIEVLYHQKKDNAPLQVRIKYSSIHPSVAVIEKNLDHLHHHLWGSVELVQVQICGRKTDGVPLRFVLLYWLVQFSKVHFRGFTRGLEGASILGVMVSSFLTPLAILEPLWDLVDVQLSEFLTGIREWSGLPQCRQRRWVLYALHGLSSP